ncbi:MAG: alpha-glucuronidase family glycosyl hydrolase [Chitinophagaceae bacterium]
MEKKFLANLSVIIFSLLLLSHSSRAEGGYDLWLRYHLVSNSKILATYRSAISGINCSDHSPIIASAKEEMLKGIEGLLETKITLQSSVQNGSIVIGSGNSLPLKLTADISNDLKETGNEGFILSTKVIEGKKIILITGNSDAGVLYGVFHFLRLLQTQQPITQLHIVSTPRIKLRMLDHWDNLDGSVERGYAGNSIWKWNELPGTIDPRYKDYARANASIGINAVSITNVNANATVLTHAYLEKVAALANIFRAYSIKVFLTARFSAPIEIGGLKTADPSDADVQRWWKEKANEIYSLIPDFGGFLIKANSEGQPGPQKYNRTHADGANLFADAVAPHNGIVIWRAFVYSNETSADRHKQAYDEFVPLDGKFRDNVLIQVKNGAIDFQPREPFHPLFGAMPKTPLAMEFQLTQEYLGQGTHLVYLAPLFKECLQSDTYAEGKGSIVAKVIDGSLDHHSLTCMAGVANIGNDTDWCGHPFAQANWYALGRLAWDYDLTSSQIADEWLRMTFTNDESFVRPITQMMLDSRETTVSYMTPLGLHHIMGYGHHYGPAPWVNDAPRADWNCTYYHKADSKGIGFDRTESGSNAIAQYKPEVQKQWNSLETCDERYLLWFHHVPWDYKMKSSRTLWNELCYRYYTGAAQVKKMQETWTSVQSKIDLHRYNHVAELLEIQHNEAVWWRNACLLYFQTFSNMPIPSQYEQPDHSLDYYKAIKLTRSPGH